MLALGMIWLNWRARVALATGEGYGQHEDSLPETDTAMRARAQNDGFDLAEIASEPAVRALPPIALALAPVIIVVAVNLAFLQLVVPRLATAPLALPLFGETTIEAVRGLWAVIVALCTAILFLITTNWSRLKALRVSLNSGADAAVLPIFNTASLVGFGAVVAALPAFAMISDAMLSMGAGNPLVAVSMAVTTLSALTGSASGGMSIALDALGTRFVDLAAATGTSLEVMHRVTAVSSGALDALPHNGAVITVLGICKLSHRDSYLDILAVAVVIPMISLVVLILLASLFGAF
jgi:H+/gluconate symporter-like permease